MMYPWLQADLDEYIAKKDDLPHALLVQGESGLGKWQFAYRLLQVLIGEKAEPLKSLADIHLITTPSNYHLIDHVAFKDNAMRYITQEAVDKKKPSKIIGIDQIRQMSEAITKSPHNATAKAVLIYPAEAMNQNAANALLKTLEEPAGDCYIILVSSQASQLSATIKSRCLNITLNVPDKERSKRWLLQQQPDHYEQDIDNALHWCFDRPLNAQRFISQQLNANKTFVADLNQLINQGLDPVTCASQWVKQIGDIECILSWLSFVYAKAIHFRQASFPQNLETIQGLHTLYNSLLEKLSAQALFDCYDHIQSLKKMPSNIINVELALEDALLMLSRSISTQAKINKTK